MPIEDDCLAAEQIAELIKDIGYRAQVVALPDGTSAIASMASGRNFYIIHYGVSEPASTAASLRFLCTIENKQPSLESLNAWHRSTRFLKVYLDQDGMLTVEMDCLLRGTKPKYIKECIERWDGIIGDIIYIERLAT